MELEVDRMIGFDHRKQYVSIEGFFSETKIIK